MAKFINNIWFRCISVLLIIAVVSGALITVLSNLLYVSSEERTARAIKKIYGEEKEFTITLDVEQGDSAVEYAFGKIEKIYNVGDDLLFMTTGYNGYKNGTITVWVKVVIDNESDKIDKVILQDYDKQTLMSKLGSGYYDGFLTDVTTAYKEGKDFSAKDETKLFNPVSGATMSANAGCNAVNCVIKYLGENA